MRAVLYVLSFLSVIAAGFWAYRENYATQAVLRETRALQREISGLRDALSIQRAEWAWLNRPDRLRDLVNLTFERVPLLPMEARQFEAIANLPYPAPPEMVAPEVGPASDPTAVAALGAVALTAAPSEGL